MRRIFTAFVVLSCTAAVHANILKNGGFEKMTGWNVVTHNQDFASITQVTDDVQKGKTALKFEISQKPKVYICAFQHFKIEQGRKTLKIRLKYKAPAGGGLLLVTHPKAEAKIFGLPASGEWKTVDFKADIPENISGHAALEIRFGKQGFMLVDDVSAEFGKETK